MLVEQGKPVFGVTIFSQEPAEQIGTRGALLGAVRDGEQLQGSQPRQLPLAHNALVATKHSRRLQGF